MRAAQHQPLKQLDSPRPMFIDDRLVYPGELIYTDTVDEKGEKEGKPKLVDVSAPSAPVAQIAVLPTGPTGPAPTVPQGLPAGAVQVGNKWLAPLDDGSGNWAEVVPATIHNDPALAAQVEAEATQAKDAAKAGESAAAQSDNGIIQAQRDREAQEAANAANDPALLTVKQLKAELELDPPVTYETDANKARLVELVKEKRSKAKG